MIFATIALIAGAAIGIYHLKYLKAGTSTKTFRIHLKDGRVTTNDNGFGRFNEQNSGPFGQATTDDLDCYQCFPGQRNWNSDLKVYLICRNNRQGGTKYEEFWLYANGYNVQGHSNNSNSYKSAMNGDHWRNLCDLYVENVNKTPMVSQVAIDTPRVWQVYGFIEYVYPTTLTDYLSSSDVLTIVDRIRVTGNSGVNFDVKILPVIATIQDPCCPNTFTSRYLYRPGRNR